MDIVKLVVFVPTKDADSIRQAIGEAGAGKIGNYTFSSFSTKGIGRFKPMEGAHPTIGSIGSLESVEEERIECVCEKSLVPQVLEAIKKAHPYEEVPVDMYQVELL